MTTLDWPPDFQYPSLSKDHFGRAPYTILRCRFSFGRLMNLFGGCWTVLSVQQGSFNPAHSSHNRNLLCFRHHLAFFRFVSTQNSHIESSRAAGMCLGASSLCSGLSPPIFILFLRRNQPDQKILAVILLPTVFTYQVQVFSL